MGFQVACVLIVTLTTTGLAALAASWARGHWFLRTAAFLVVLAPLLFVPAYEPFIALALEGAMIAAGVWIWRRRRLTAVGAKPQAMGGPRFSMATLLLAMVLCGAAAAIAPRAPTLNRYAWQSVAIIGVCAGTAVLLGAWAAMRRGWRIVPAAGGALLAALLVSCWPAWFDWFASRRSPFRS